MSGDSRPKVTIPSDRGWARPFRELSAELEVSRRLGRKLQQILWREMKEIAHLEFGSAIAYVLFLRAERTFSSIRSLARLRNGDDAFALVRVLVEKIINGEYLLFNDAETALDYVRYHAFREWRDFEELREIGPDLAPQYSDEDLALLKQAYQRAESKTLPSGESKRRFGRGNDWTELGLSKRAEFVDEHLRNNYGLSKSTAIRVLYYLAYRKSAPYLHGMFQSLARSFQFEEGKPVSSSEELWEVRVGIKIKDTDAGVAAQAMNQGNLAAFGLLLFLNKVFLNDKHGEWILEFTRYYSAKLKEARELK